MELTKFDASYKDFRDMLGQKEQEISELKIVADTRAGEKMKEREHGREIEAHYKAKMRQQQVGRRERLYRLIS